MLIGEPGVGKTAIVEGIAQRIASGDVPESLRSKRVLSLDLGSLVGQQVSVRGARGYMPEYKRPYLVASEARVRIASMPAATSRPDTTQ